MNKNDIKKGQVWVSKSDGRLIYIKSKHDSKRWNTANSVNKDNHHIADVDIINHYQLLKNGTKVFAKKVKRKDGKPILIKQLVDIKIKRKPSFLPKFIHRILLDWLIDTKKINIK